jgi:hypothetical protein
MTTARLNCKSAKAALPSASGEAIWQLFPARLKDSYVPRNRVDGGDSWVTWQPIFRIATQARDVVGKTDII